MFLLLMLLYIFSSAAFEWITLHPKARGPERDEVFAEMVELNFRSLPATMLTIMQFVCMDNLAVIYKPLIEADWTLCASSLLTILVVGIVLTNLVTAVVVNSTLEQALQDKEAIRCQESDRRKKMVTQLKNMFIRLDEDESGELALDEIKNCTDADKALPFSVMTVADPIEIFHALYVDDNGPFTQKLPRHSFRRRHPVRADIQAELQSELTSSPN
jgi:hypothetical protein